ncbi:MAG: BatD family protein [Bacteroidales bacterium]|nr:BatD family protein [Bacteroidales bacterium]
MKNKTFFIAIMMALIPFLGISQVDFTLQGPSVVQQGTSFQVKFVLQSEGDYKNFTPPNFQGFMILSGPNTSQQTSIQMSGTKVIKSIVSTYSYTLRANDAGEFTIGAGSISVEGKVYKSNTLPIKVTTGASSQPHNLQQGGTQQNASHTINPDSKDIFVRAYPSKRDPYQGEQIIITYKLFTKVGVSSIRPRTGSTYPGFWMQDLMDPNQRLVQNEEVVSGVRYITADIKKVALFPVRAGEITIEPLILDLTAQYTKARQGRTGDPFLDQFFNGMFQSVDNVELTVQSESVKLNVKPYPTNNKPASFKGATGNYTFKPELSSTEAKTNEAITLKFTIAGNGNIELADLPEINFPVDFEVYDPKINQNVKKTASGVSGWKSFEYLIIPRAAGTFTIPAVPFSFFDPAKGTYVTLTSPAYTILVEKGDGTVHDISYTAIHQQDIKYIGNDIRHLKLPPYTFTLTGSVIYGSWQFWAIAILLIIMFFVAVIATAKTRKQRRNVALMRNKKATKVARNRLKRGYSYLKNNQSDQFFEENTNALWGYLSDKFTIPRSALSRETIYERLSEKGIGDDYIKEIVDIIDAGEFARYAPGDKQHDMEKIYRNSIDIISKIEQNLR